MKRYNIFLCLITAILFFILFSNTSYADSIEDYELSSFYTDEEIAFLTNSGKLNSVQEKHVRELCEVLGFDANLVIKENFYGIALGPYVEYLEDLAIKATGNTSNTEYDANGGVTYSYYQVETCSNDICLCCKYYAAEDEPYIVNNPDGSTSAYGKIKDGLGIYPKYIVITSKNYCKALVEVYDEAYLDEAAEAAVNAGMPAFSFIIYENQWGRKLTKTGKYIEGVERYTYDVNSRKYSQNGQEIDENTAIDADYAYVATFQQYYANDKSKFVGSDAATTERKLKQLKKEKDGIKFDVDCERDFLITQAEIDNIRSIVSESMPTSAITMKYFDETNEALSDFVNYTVNFEMLDLSYIDEAKREMLILINNFRTENGLNPLDDSSTILNNISSVRAIELAYLMSKDHCRPNGEPLKQSFPVGENSCYIVSNNESPKDLAQMMFNSWLSSEGHRANMLNPNYFSFSFSVSLAKKGDNYVYYGVQDFSSQDPANFDKVNKHLNPAVIYPKGKLYDSNGNPTGLDQTPILQDEGYTVQLIVGSTPAIKGIVPVYAETNMADAGNEMCRVILRDENYKMICLSYVPNNGYLDKKYVYFTSIYEVEDGTVWYEIGGSDQEVIGNLGRTEYLTIESNGVMCNAVHMYNP